VTTPELSTAHHFAGLEDPRIGRTKKHSLQDILVIALCAVLSRADSFDDIEEFGRAKREWLGPVPGAAQRHPVARRVRPGVRRPEPQGVPALLLLVDERRV
jgi:hypothetical protein